MKSKNTLSKILRDRGKTLKGIKQLKRYLPKNEEIQHNVFLLNFSRRKYLKRLNKYLTLYKKTDFEGLAPIISRDKLFSNKDSHYHFSDKKLKSHHRVIGWKFVLSNRAEHKKTYNSFHKTNKKIMRDNGIHRGHMIGNALERFTLFECHDFFNKNNLDNIYHQFQSANGDKYNNVFYGQEHYENIIKEYLESESQNSKRYVYCEVEVVFMKFSDIVPIGTRYLCIFPSSPNKDFHVFIPNIDATRDRNYLGFYENGLSDG